MFPSKGLLYGVSCLATATGILLIAQRREKAHLSPRELDSATRDKLVEVGSAIPDAHLSTTHGKVSLVELVRGQWTFVLYRKAIAAGDAEWPGILLDRVGRDRLRVVLVGAQTTGNRRLAEEHERQNGRGSLLFVFDRGHAFLRAFRLPSETVAASFLSTPEGKSAFSAPGVMPEGTMRRLAERLILRKSPTELYAPPQGFNAGAPLPAIKVRRVGEGNVSELGSLCRGGCTVLFFPAYCTTCGLTSLMAELKDISDRMGGFGKKGVYAVLSRRFRATAFEAVSQVGRSPGWSVYVAEEYVRSWEDPYFVDIREFSIPKAIHFTEKAKVDRVCDYQDWAAPWREATPRETHPEAVAAVASTSAAEYRPVPIYTDALSDSLAEATARPTGQELYVVDRANSRILVLDAEGRYLRQIGQLGQGPGELSSPLAVAHGPGGRIYVIDGKSVQSYEPEGRPHRRFGINTLSDSIAVNEAGEVLLNTPRQGNLVTAYDPSGRKLRKFGQLLPLSKAYSGKEGSADMRRALGRAFLVTAEEGRLFVCFQFIPIVQLYDRSGRPLWETRLSGPFVDELVRTFWREPGARPSVGTKSMDGLPLPKMTIGACLTSKRNLLVLFADNTIAVVSPDGRQLASLQRNPPVPATAAGFTFSMGHLYFTSRARCWRSAAEIGY